MRSRLPSHFGSPVIFSKPDTALIKNNEPFYHPDFSNDIHHEVELVIKISKMGKKIQPKFARNYFTEIGLGIDFTARDMQSKLKEKGLISSKTAIEVVGLVEDAQEELDAINAENNPT